MEWITDPRSWIAFLTLFSLEMVLGIDNIIFISILASRLPAEMQSRARVIGLGLALVMRVILLFSLSWVMSLTEPLFSVFGLGISGRDLILLLGGLFLIGKATHEIHNKLEGDEHDARAVRTYPSFTSVLVQIALLDIVFSLDSVITAVGMVDDIAIMISAVVASIAVMMLAAKPVSEFVNRHPTVKMLALAFLLLIGFTLVVEGLHQHIPKGYIYAAMAFSVFVEMLNLQVQKRKKATPVKLHEPTGQDISPAS